MGTIGAVESLLYVALLPFVLGLVWLAAQVHRVRLLDRALRVSQRSAPELDAAVAEVRERLGYTRRTAVYVTDGITQNMVGQSVLGTRILLLRGDFVAELITERKDAELVFLLATYFGALKARMDRLNVVLVVMSAVGVLRLFNPLLKPWYRATVYTGDQLAFLCCNDLEVSLSAAFRSLVGKQMAPLIRADGVVDQARSVRRNWILWWAQLVSDSPHPTNRYLNLLAFAATHQVEQYARFLQGLEPDGAGYVERYRSRHRAGGGSESLHTMAEVGGALVVGAAVVIGFVVADEVEESGLAPVVAAVLSGSLDPTPTQTPTPEPTPQPPTPGPTEQPTFDFQALLGDLPADLRAACYDVSQEQYDALGAVLDAAARCEPTAAGTPAWVEVNQFTSSADASAAFEGFAQQVGATFDGAWTATCAPATPAWYEWSEGDSGGSIGCFGGPEGEVGLFWWDDDSRRVSVALGEPTDTAEDVVGWWGEFPVF